MSNKLIAAIFCIYFIWLAISVFSMFLRYMIYLEDVEKVNLFLNQQQGNLFQSFLWELYFFHIYYPSTIKDSINRYFEKWN